MNGNMEDRVTPGSDFEGAVFDAMRRAGWILPQTVEDVLRAEQELDQSAVQLPSRLADPYAILDGPSRALRLGGRSGAPDDQSVEENLAQAAREGGTIPPTVQEQMRKDRDAAEAEGNG